ncbi:MAG: hypothetical protein HY820_02275 [Acidobacteria bacterium]|nr:hypothetical protein [Acidobacteriota bacterium]
MNHLQTTESSKAGLVKGEDRSLTMHHHRGGQVCIVEAVPWSPYCVSCQERAEQSVRDEDHAEEPPYALAS